ncbi:MAG: type VI secretion system protein TssA [Gammaproteobacteria bacterium]|nr:type VI secretion system protein TssA [Gammaproteobacteria bacterium]MCH9743695.1 type VI secretion system protein TssA [Gammaproteobacteria bacterium]
MDDEQPEKQEEPEESEQSENPEQPENSEQPESPEQSTQMDLEPLLAPISAAKPTGKDLRNDAKSQYYTLKNIRNDLRKKEADALLEGGEVEKIKWDEIIKIASNILIKKSKDLEVAAWLVEALLRERGFRGLSDGVQLLIGLVDQYWEELYPREDGDFEVTIAPIEGLSGATRDGVLIKPLYMLPIVMLPEDKVITTWDYIKALDLFTASSSADSEQYNDITSLDDLKAACQSLEADVFIEKKARIKVNTKYFAQLQNLLHEKTEGKWVFSFSIVERALNKCLEALHYLGAFAFESADGFVDPRLKDQANSRSRYIVNDEEEVRLALKAVERFYRNNHPQSPMAYVIRRAANWSTMSLAELIPQILNDDRSQQEYCRMVGLDPNELGQADDYVESEEDYALPANEIPSE